MRAGCPGVCDIGTQRPLSVGEFSQLSNNARAEIMLLEETEENGGVYVLPTANRSC